jgi:hypothetical protein
MKNTINQSINTFCLSVLILFLVPIFLPTFNSFLFASDWDCYDSCNVVPWFYDERLKDGKPYSYLREFQVFIPEIGMNVGGSVYFASKIDTCFGRNEKVIKIDSVRCINRRILYGMTWTYHHIIKAAIKRILFGEYVDWGDNFDNNQPMQIRIRIPSCFQGIIVVENRKDTCFTIRPCPFELPCCDVTYTIIKDSEFPDSIRIQNVQINSVPQDDPCIPYYNIPCGPVCDPLEEGTRIRWLVLDVQEKNDLQSNLKVLYSNNLVFVELPNLPYRIEIFDFMGNSVFAKFTDKTPINIDLSNFKSGVYFIRFVNLQNGLTSYSKFIKIK